MAIDRSNWICDCWEVVAYNVRCKKCKKTNPYKYIRYTQREDLIPKDILECPICNDMCKVKGHSEWVKSKGYYIEEDGKVVFKLRKSYPQDVIDKQKARTL